MEDTDDLPPKGTPLRRGWTTGACATAATKAALGALLGHGFDDPVTITLPGGQTPGFSLAHEAMGEGFAEAGIVKDAGDDPDVTHGALVIARVSRGATGMGIMFRAGEGVGIVTKPGLPVAVGEPAINPVPRRMMTGVAAEAGVEDLVITISIRDGARLAEKTWNPRLGIVGGLSILGTTGIVIPYSCSAWIHSIRSGIDVARAMGLDHLVGSTGDASEKAARQRLGLPDEAYIDMGDFVGGMLKYLRAHPVRRVTLAGGFAKMSKLAQGAMDLHSARSTVDLIPMAEWIERGDRLEGASTAAEALQRTPELGPAVALRARDQVKGVVGAQVEVGVLVVGRDGAIVGEA